MNANIKTNIISNLKMILKRGLVKNMKRAINELNSSMGVQCNAKTKCWHRHTKLCDNCKHNIGKYKEETCYEPVERGVNKRSKQSK